MPAVAYPSNIKPTAREEEYRVIGDGGVNDRRFKEYYDGDRTFLGDRPISFPTNDRVGATNGISSDDATVAGTYQHYRSAGVVPDTFRSLSLKEEAEMYANLTLCAEKDIMMAAKQEIEEELELSDKRYREKKAEIQAAILEGENKDRTSRSEINDNSLARGENKNVDIDQVERDAMCSVVHRVQQAWIRAVKLSTAPRTRRIRISSNVCFEKIFVM